MGFNPEVVYYSPKRAGVCLGVIGASSFLPGVQIFTALNQREKKKRRVLFTVTYYSAPFSQMLNISYMR